MATLSGKRLANIHQVVGRITMLFNDDDGFVVSSCRVSTVARQIDAAQILTFLSVHLGTRRDSYLHPLMNSDMILVVFHRQLHACFLFLHICDTVIVYSQVPFSRC